MNPRPQSVEPHDEITSPMVVAHGIARGQTELNKALISPNVYEEMETSNAALPKVIETHRSSVEQSNTNKSSYIAMKMRDSQGESKVHQIKQEDQSLKL
jgi:hypothetical protein